MVAGLVQEAARTSSIARPPLRLSPSDRRVVVPPGRPLERAAHDGPEMVGTAARANRLGPAARGGQTVRPWATSTSAGVGHVLPDGRVLLRRRLVPGRRRRQGRRWSARTAPARRRCCAWSPATSRRRRARSPAAAASGVMRQFIGSVRDDTTVRDLLVSVAPPARPRGRARAVDAAELAMMERDDEPTPAGLRAGARRLGRRRRLRRRGRSGTSCCTQALGHAVTSGRSGASCAPCPAASRSGWRSRRCCAGPTRCCCSTSRTTTSTSRASAGWRSALRETPQDRAVRQPRPRAARPHRRPGGHASRAAPAWTHGGGFATYHEARARPARAARGAAAALGRGARAAQGAGADAAAAGRDLAGHGQPLPRDADPAAQVRGGRPAAGAAAGAERARCGCAAGAPACGRSTCERLELTGLMQPFDLEVFYGERVGGAGQQRLGQVALPAAARPASTVAHTGGVEARRAGRPRATSPRPTSTPSWRARTLLDLLWEHRVAAARAGDGGAAPVRAGEQAEQPFETLSGGQQARFQILLLELDGATLLLLDEPTDNLDLRQRRGARGRAGRVRRARSWR